jgi:hypothetical protein
MKTPVNAKTLKQHITYNWWKYLLIAAAAFGLVDLLYSVTAYRPPREKTVSLYVYGYMDEQGLTDYMENVRQKEMPDMEEMRPQILMVDDAYGPMQLMTYLAAGEGDLYLLPREQFLSYAESGALVPLENEKDLIALFDGAGANLQSGWRRETETGETHLYGIPQDKLPGLGRYAYAQDGYLCVVASGQNQDNAMKFLRILSRDFITPPEEEPSPAPEAP